MGAGGVAALMPLNEHHGDFLEPRQLCETGERSGHHQSGTFWVSLNSSTLEDSAWV